MLPLPHGPALRPKGVPNMSSGLPLSGGLSKTDYIQAVDNFCLLVVVGVMGPCFFPFYNRDHKEAEKIS